MLLADFVPATAGTHKTYESNVEPKTVSVIMNTPRGMHDKDILITVIVTHNCMVECIGRMVPGEGSGQCDVAVDIDTQTVFIALCAV